MEEKQIMKQVMNAGAPRNTGVRAKVFPNSKNVAAADSGRLKGVTVVKPIVYGNVAWFLGDKKDDDGHTHQWSVYLRSYHNEDMSTYVKRVQFKLHESYTEATRIIQSPPYTLTETGWGEFEIAIKIFFQDSNERPVTVYHFLKLFDREEDGNVKVVAGPINSEFYDELVFSDPTLKMHKLLSQPKQVPQIATHSTNYEQKKVQDLKKILEAKQKVKQEIEELKAKLANTKDGIQKMRQKIAQ